jgi:hypothetical protein
MGQLLIASDRDIENKGVVHENVVLGIPGHLNALKRWFQQRSKSALEHAPGAGPKERMIGRNGLLMGNCRL